jgi:hypothetical protein
MRLFSLITLIFQRNQRIALLAAESSDPAPEVEAAAAVASCSLDANRQTSLTAQELMVVCPSYCLPEWSIKKIRHSLFVQDRDASILVLKRNIFDLEEVAATAFVIVTCSLFFVLATSNLCRRAWLNQVWAVAEFIIRMPIGVFSMRRWWIGDDFLKPINSTFWTGKKLLRSFAKSIFF